MEEVIKIIRELSDKLRDAETSLEYYRKRADELYEENKKLKEKIEDMEF